MQTASSRLNVLQILGNAIVGGMETYVMRLLEKLPRDRFHLMVVAPYESTVTERMRDLGVDVIALPITIDPEWSTTQIVAALVKAQSIDVIQTHLENAHILGGLVGRLTGKPVLATIHGRSVTLADLEAHRISGTHIAVVCKHGYFHAISLGVNPAQLHLLPNGVDHRIFAPRDADPALRARWGIPPGVPVAGFVGRLSEEKGPERFLAAALRVHAKVPDAHFVLAGEGPMREELETFIERQAMDYVHLVGVQADMPAVYAQLDVLVSSSKSEGMPLALMEAMACGVPVVARRVGGVTDIVLHGTTGRLVSADDADGLSVNLAEVLLDHEGRRRMGESSRERAVRRFLLDDCIDATAQLLTRLAQVRSNDRRLSALPPGKGETMAANSSDAAGKAAQAAGGKPAR